MKSFTPHFHESSKEGVLTCCVEHVTCMQKWEVYKHVSYKKEWNIFLLTLQYTYKGNV